PRPGLPHQFAAYELGWELGGPYRRGLGGPGGWWFIGEPELHLGDDILIPDLAGWRTSRMATVPTMPATSLAPDWVCEVLSPSTAGFDRTVKMAAYAAAGVEWMWLVDPPARMVQAFGRTAGGWQLEGQAAGNVRILLRPFDVAAVNLGVLW